MVTPEIPDKTFACPINRTILQIRNYIGSDLDALLDLFYQTVHTVNARHYTSAQLDAWAPAPPEKDAWNIRLRNSITLVATQRRRIIGFASLTDDGLVDLLYVHKGFQRNGAGTALLNALIRKAQNRHMPALKTEASITAKPFFEAHGFLTGHTLHKRHRGVIFTTFSMSKQLNVEKQKT
jgi:putative acetyltransferase